MVPISSPSQKYCLSSQRREPHTEVTRAFVRIESGSGGPEARAHRAVGCGVWTLRTTYTTGTSQTLTGSCHFAEERGI